jgi:hypothetical protein
MFRARRASIFWISSLLRLICCWAVMPSGGTGQISGRRTSIPPLPSPPAPLRLRSSVFHGSDGRPDQGGRCGTRTHDLSRVKARSACTLTSHRSRRTRSQARIRTSRHKPHSSVKAFRATFRGTGVPHPPGEDYPPDGPSAPTIFHGVSSASKCKRIMRPEDRQPLAPTAAF